MDAQNWGHGADEDEKPRGGSSGSKADKYGKKAWTLYMDFRDEEALKYINWALKLNKNHAINWNCKAIILEGLENYAEAEECYNRSLELSKSNVVFDNKARMLYDWAYKLMDGSKKDSNALRKLEKANEKITNAIRALSGDSDEDIEKYLKLRDSIKYNIEYENTYRLNLETLEKFDKSELFTITGSKFYKVKVSLGAVLRLVTEHDNKFDGDAIAVYSGGDKIGYVANKDYTKYYMTSSASELKIKNEARAEYLLYLDRYSEIQFMIGRIIL